MGTIQELTQQAIWHAIYSIVYYNTLPNETDTISKYCNYLVSGTHSCLQCSIYNHEALTDDLVTI
jgi:hypothetical protein